MDDPKDCWEIKKCSATQYMNCKAYQEKKKCWEISNPRGSRSMLLCLQMGCPVYDIHMEEIDREIEYRLRLMFPFLSSIEMEEEAPQG
jgi:hypothetical protein